MHRVVGLLVFCLAAVIWLHSSVGAAYGVSVEVGPPKTAKPGDLVTHVFVVTNTGTVADQYDLRLTLPNGWTALPVPGQVSLGGGPIPWCSVPLRQATPACGRRPKG